MIRKLYVLGCDVKGCQAVTKPWRTRRGAKDEARGDGWKIYVDERKKERALCTWHVRSP